MVLNAFDLTGKVAIVTGCDTGLGQGMTLGLAQAGCDIVGINRKIPHDTAAQVQALGRRFHAIQADLSQENDMSGLVDQAVAAMGRVDILVNNAGITKDGLMLRMKDEDFDRVIQTNLRGAFVCVREAAKIMTRQRHGRIINISSVVGQMGNAGQINYASAKAGLIGLTKSAAKELAGRNVTVNAVAPGFVETDMTASLPDDVRAAYIDAIPLKRLGTPQDIADAVAFLASPGAGYITGQVIAVNGGMYC